MPKTRGSILPEDDDTSDVEIEGIDQEGDDEEMDDTGDDVSSAAASSDRGGGGNDDDVVEKLAKEELEELEEARRERMELMAAEREAISVDPRAGADKKLQYLLAQSDVFAHFLAGSVAASAAKGRGKKGKGGKASGRSAKKGRMTEAEEDARLMKAAQSKRRTVRLDKQPSNLSSHCKMHPYQLEGLNWMIKLHDNGINGVLADEMGLGKTLQTISLFAYLRESRGVRGPHIVIVPKSVLGNWIKEIKHWCPSIKAVKMPGNKEARKKIVTEDLPKDPVTGKHTFDVLVTSYEGILKEKGALGKVDWKYLVIDEAHRIKNENSSLSRVVRTMNTQFRLLITGTPLQNNLHELWALLNFLLPEIFGDAEQFDEWFNLSGSDGQENVIKKLHTVLRPFMLRRVKKDVAHALPPKKETKLFVGLTAMQQEWYKKVLTKDAHELNALGGPSKVRLLNILMQLRKVCNHPYLFDGAEPGPPYTDGPHLWENSAKFQLLHKLLPKLKSRGSRVLIFTQMTRVLDILEDYLRLMQYGYCRIDGNTDGDSRDNQMEDFNREGSDKFCFILSTRAGGLGINLATADIVVLFDSDWNPQVDLQAMDRAHRIGQKKPVQVFRFITEGSVEEKIIERADRKLFLDAAVVQQGRLAEQNTSLDKNALMHMVRFGADQILSGKGGTYTDDDIDALIAKGEEKTDAINAKLQTDVKHNLADFSLMGDDEGMDTFTFGGENYRGKKAGSSGAFINLPQRERKRNYDVNEYFRDAMNAGSTTSGMKAHAADAAAKKRKKGPNLQDFQLFDRERLDKYDKLERDLAHQKEVQINAIKELRLKAVNSASRDDGRYDLPDGQSAEELIRKAEELEGRLDELDLSPQEKAQRERLLNEGFPDWSKKDYRLFLASLERHGRYDIVSIVEDMAEDSNKDEAEVKRYFVAFWLHYRRIADWRKVLDRIEKGERKVLRLRQIRNGITEKIERHLDETFGALFDKLEEEQGTGRKKKKKKSKDDSDKDDDGKKKKIPTPDELLEHSWTKIKFAYTQGTRHRAYTEEEDAFLLFMMYRHGYGAAERIRLEIRRAWQFRFDWYFKSRSAQEIQKRCDVIVKMVERENEGPKKKAAKAAAAEEEEAEGGAQAEAMDTGK